MRWLFLVGAIAAACAGSPDRLRGPSFGDAATAQDVAGAFAVSHDEPGTALVLPSLSRWGAIAAFGELSVGWPPSGLAVAVAGGKIRVFDPWHDHLARVATGEPVVVRVLTSGASRSPWASRVTGIERVPLAFDPAVVLDDARRRFDQFVVEHAAAEVTALAAAEAATPGQPLHAKALDVRREAILPSWNGRGLTVAYVVRHDQFTQLQRVESRRCSKYDSMFRGADGVTPDLPQIAPCAPTPPMMITTRRAYATVQALVLEYDGHGQLVSARGFSPYPLPGAAPATTEH